MILLRPLALPLGISFDEFCWIYYNRRQLRKMDNIWCGVLREVDPDMPEPIFKIFTAIREHCDRYMCLPHHIFKPFDLDSTGYIRSELVSKAPPTPHTMRLK